MSRQCRSFDNFTHDNNVQFVQSGPDIPDQLLQAHEDGSVVIFCGAGISYPAGLPGFQGLVDNIYSTVGTKLSEIEKQAYLRDQFDATLDLLERRLPGGRLAVRTALANSLRPKLRRKGATHTHQALLELGRCRDGALRLVTTNFDRIFEHLIRRSKPAIATYSAPLLPIPKNSRWNGIVYLHGLLKEELEESALNRLVVTSGDFGLAYLTERWAARFVSDLFRNYVVCFIGYSINDPVLRYMMDALAADRMLGEITPQAYAFGDCEIGKEASKAIEWEAKGVRPVLYEVPVGTHDHSALHNTLRTWAATYRDGVQGKERIVVDYAMTRPSTSTNQDDFVGRMLWALSHESGLPAKRFAEIDPVPSLDWLGPLCDGRFGHVDLPRFGVSPNVKVDGKLSYSLVRRPAPYTKGPRMNLVSAGGVQSQWDEVMFQLARWLVRHLNDPALVLWVAERGGQLHEQFKWLVERALDALAALERDKNVAELDRIRAGAPNAIPNPHMLTVWRLLLTCRVKIPQRGADLHDWHRRLKRDGLTPTLRLELRELLAPKVVLKKPFAWGEDATTPDEATRLKQLVDWDLVLESDNAHYWISDIGKSELWRGALPELADDLEQSLVDALDLLRELGEADGRHDRAYWDIPSISPHWQNRGFRDWVVLIDSLRDAWLAIHREGPKRAEAIVERWLSRPYPTFRRLALFAATHPDIAPEGEWVDWLLEGDAWWLWSVESQRETMRVLVLRGSQLADGNRKRLEAGILAGPPRDMFRANIGADEWQDLVDRAVWLRLAKLASGGAQLSGEAHARLEDLSKAHAEWQVAENERDEFSHWMSGTGDPDYEDRRQIDRAPRTRKALVKWLQRPRPDHPFYEDTWRETCEARFFVAAFSLCELAQEDIWPAARWREALQAWSGEKLVERSWRYIAPLLRAMPDDILLEIAHSASWWLEEASKVLDRHQEAFLALCRRFLPMPEDGSGDSNGPVTNAINHPIGHVTQALLNFWFQRDLNDDQGLPEELKVLFTELCDVRVDRYRHGRVLLASRLIALFRVDPGWTQTHLLPLFDWRSAIEARAAWEGFLWSPRLYRPLLVAFKISFLEAAQHYAELGEHGRQYAALLTYAALDPGDTFTSEELSAAIAALPREGLEESAQALVYALEGAGEQREQHWIHRILPFWNRIWPKSRALISKRVSEELARLAIAARGEFPSALSVVHDWLQPPEHPEFLVHLIKEAAHCERFPKEALTLLDALIEDQPWPPTDLGTCLTAIERHWSGASNDQRFHRLADYVRRHQQ